MNSGSENNIKISSRYHRSEFCEKLHYVYTSRQCDEYLNYLEELRRIIFGENYQKMGKVTSDKSINYHTYTGRTLVYELQEASNYGISLSPIPSETETVTTETFLAEQHVLPQLDTATVVLPSIPPPVLPSAAIKLCHNLPKDIDERMKNCLHASAEAIGSSANEYHSNHIYDSNPYAVKSSDYNDTGSSSEDESDYHDQKDLEENIDEDFAVLEDFATVLEESESVFEEVDDYTEDLDDFIISNDEIAQTIHECSWERPVVANVISDFKEALSTNQFLTKKEELPPSPSALSTSSWETVIEKTVKKAGQNLRIDNFETVDEPRSVSSLVQFFENVAEKSKDQLKRPNFSFSTQLEPSYTEALEEQLPVNETLAQAECFSKNERSPGYSGLSECIPVISKVDVNCKKVLVEQKTNQESESLITPRNAEVLLCNDLVENSSVPLPSLQELAKQPIDSNKFFRDVAELKMLNFDSDYTKKLPLWKSETIMTMNAVENPSTSTAQPELESVEQSVFEPNETSHESLKTLLSEKESFQNHTDEEESLSVTPLSTEAHFEDLNPDDYSTFPMPSDNFHITTTTSSDSELMDLINDYVQLVINAPRQLILFQNNVEEEAPEDVISPSNSSHAFENERRDKGAEDLELEEEQKLVSTVVVNEKNYFVEEKTTSEVFSDILIEGESSDLAKVEESKIYKEQLPSAVAGIQLEAHFLPDASESHPSQNEYTFSDIVSDAFDDTSPGEIQSESFDRTVHIPETMTAQKDNVNPESSNVIEIFPQIVTKNDNDKHSFGVPMPFQDFPNPPTVETEHETTNEFAENVRNVVVSNQFDDHMMGTVLPSFETENRQDISLEETQISAFRAEQEVSNQNVLVLSLDLTPELCHIPIVNPDDSEQTDCSKSCLNSFESQPIEQEMSEHTTSSETITCEKEECSEQISNSPGNVQVERTEDSETHHESGRKGSQPTLCFDVGYDEYDICAADHSLENQKNEENSTPQMLNASLTENHEKEDQVLKLEPTSSAEQVVKKHYQLVTPVPTISVSEITSDGDEERVERIRQAVLRSKSIIEEDSDCLKEISTATKDQYLEDVVECQKQKSQKDDPTVCTTSELTNSPSDDFDDTKIQKLNTSRTAHQNGKEELFGVSASETTDEQEFHSEKEGNPEKQTEMVVPDTSIDSSTERESSIPTFSFKNKDPDMETESKFCPSSSELEDTHKEVVERQEHINDSIGLVELDRTTKADIDVFEVSPDADGRLSLIPFKSDSSIAEAATSIVNDVLNQLSQHESDFPATEACLENKEVNTVQAVHKEVADLEEHPLQSLKLEEYEKEGFGYAKKQDQIAYEISTIASELVTDVLNKVEQEVKETDAMNDSPVSQLGISADIGVLPSEEDQTASSSDILSTETLITVYTSQTENPVLETITEKIVEERTIAAETSEDSEETNRTDQDNDETVLAETELSEPEDEEVHSIEIKELVDEVISKATVTENQEEHLQSQEETSSGVQSEQIEEQVVEFVTDELEAALTFEPESSTEKKEQIYSVTDENTEIEALENDTTTSTNVNVDGHVEHFDHDSFPVKLLEPVKFDLNAPSVKILCSDEQVLLCEGPDNQKEHSIDNHGDSTHFNKTAMELVDKVLEKVINEKLSVEKESDNHSRVDDTLESHQYAPFIDEKLDVPKKLTTSPGHQFDVEQLKSENSISTKDPKKGEGSCATEIVSTTAEFVDDQCSFQGQYFSLSEEVESEKKESKGHDKVTNETSQVVEVEDERNIENTVKVPDTNDNFVFSGMCSHGDVPSDDQPPIVVFGETILNTTEEDHNEVSEEPQEPDDEEIEKAVKEIIESVGSLMSALEIGLPHLSGSDQSAETDTSGAEKDIKVTVVSLDRLNLNTGKEQIIIAGKTKSLPDTTGIEFEEIQFPTSDVFDSRSLVEQSYDNVERNDTLLSESTLCQQPKTEKLLGSVSIDGQSDKNVLNYTSVEFKHQENFTSEENCNTLEQPGSSSVVEEVSFFLKTVCVAALAFGSSSESGSRSDCNTDIIEDASMYISNHPNSESQK